MGIKLKLDANKIYHKEFEGKKPGYNSLQVDTLLDIIIQDYEMMEQYTKAVDIEIRELQQNNKLLKDRCKQLEASQLVMNEKYKNISENADASLANIDLLKRISELEHALYKLGVNQSDK